jgi:RNA polymerase sigma factor (sigma-70 family)
MPNRALRKVFQQLRRSALLADGAGLNDAHLLDCFLNDGDEAAFAALMRRHGPMVFGVCRRLLPSWHDAEDAFQATFLVLARKASTIQPRDKVGNWLYGVAYRTALEARTLLAKRRAKERPLRDVAQADAEDDSWRELQPLLDRELQRLPDKYRRAIVCCDLQGKTRKEAAHQLGWPEGTVATRLARGRDLLRARLTRQGLTLSVATLASLMGHNGASAYVSKALEGSTVKAATVCAASTSLATGLVSAQVASLTQGVLNGMFVTKLKFAAGMLLVFGVIGFGTGVRMYAGGAQQVEGAPQVSMERHPTNLAGGAVPSPQAKEADRVKAVEEIEDRKTSKNDEDAREGKKKIEKKKRRQEEDEDDEDEDDDGHDGKKKASVKKRGHEDEDEDDGREGKKKAGAKKREREDEDEDGRDGKKKAGTKKREREDEDEDDGREGKKKAGAKKREREDEDDRRELKKTKKGKRGGDDDRREGMKKGGKKKREREDEEDDEREKKSKAKKGNRRYEDDEDERGREGKKKVERKSRRHEDEDDDEDRRENMKKGGKKKRGHEDEDDDERERKSKAKKGKRLKRE